MFEILDLIGSTIAAYASGIMDKIQHKHRSHYTIKKPSIFSVKILGFFSAN